jgi:hypothetical protein
MLLVAAAFYAGTRYQTHRAAVKKFAADPWVGISELLSLRQGDRVAEQNVAALEAKAPNANGRAMNVHSVQISRSLRNLDTTLLPLVLDTVALPSALDAKAGNGGGIAVVDDKIIIVDHRGNFFKSENKGAKIDNLKLPALPNNAELYDRLAQKPEMIRGFTVNFGFVVHDVEARSEGQNIRLIVSYERFLPEIKTTALAVSAIKIDSVDWAASGDWEDIYEGQPLKAEWYAGIGGGGRLKVRGDDLYLTVGDYNQDNVFMASRFEAQSLASDFGKILKINLHTRQKSFVSIGHRNPQGLAFTEKGRLYSTEHGPRGGDELNAIIEGSNYGWPIATFGTHYLTYDWGNRDAANKDNNFEQPVFAWVPSIGVSNLIEIVNFNAAWDGDLLVASLKAQSLYRLRQDHQGHVIYSEPILIGERLRDIAALSDGALVLWTDQSQLIFLTVDAAKLAMNSRAP